MGRGTATAEAGSNNNLSSPASPGPVQEGQTGGQALGIPLPPHSPSTCPRRSGPGLQPKEDRSPIRGVCLILIVRFSRNRAMPSIRPIVTRYRGIAGLGMGRPPTARTSENANCRQFTILHTNEAHGMSERPNVPSGTDPLLVVAVYRPALDTFATCACYQLQLGSHNLSPWRIFGGHADFGEFSASGEASVWPCGVHYRWRKLDRARPPTAQAGRADGDTFRTARACVLRA